MKYKNPIIKGFNPDPSICRVGEDYYLVTSTFEFFPGVPIYHSKNLVDWELISYCLTSKEHLDLSGVPASCGIYAPTIRYNNGIFYMTTTNVTKGGNFIVSTDDINGKWSKPVWVDMDGIDPSLFFDDDKVYYMTNAYIDKKGIALAEIDINTGELISEPRWISNGNGGRHCEAPHIYKNDGYYYLLVAEGGTEQGHMATIHRSKDVYGPYERCPHNPILSHVRLPYSPIQATGHADLVWDRNGNCFLVCLGIRPLMAGGHLHNLGRETFFAPVVWENGWPIVGDNGTINLEMDADLSGITKQKNTSLIEEFTNNQLDNRWTWVRNKDDSAYSLNNGILTLVNQGVSLSSSKDSPCFMGIRQEEFEMIFDAQVNLKSLSKESFGGITAYYNDCYHYDLFAEIINDKVYIGIRKKIHDIDAIVEKAEILKCDAINLRIISDKENYSFYYSVDGGKNYTLLGKGLTAGLCTETTHTMTFTGTFFGVFCDDGEMSFNKITCYEYK